ncbi:alpha/beta hydrolase [Mangrovimonas sp. TPBH4]|uniref:alpha/beta hydrolase n=1 Tax=Mangrovimonas sp. TPBH4 TaxID=1645914 RepID=UPI0006B65415|nr:alpha/beta hydrolase [Mangrovimonas sp. TPBH4]
MKYLLISLLFCISLWFCGCTESNRQNDKTKVVWDNIKLERDIHYTHLDSTSQILDIYMQGNLVGLPGRWFEEDTSKRKTIVHFHGGGWILGNKTSLLGVSSELIVLPFLERGYNVINVEYRRGSGTAPQAAEDAFLALKWIENNATKYHIDLNKIVLMGESAGAHLSMISGIKKSDHEFVPKAVINISGISNIQEQDQYLRNVNPDNWNYVSDWIGDTSRIVMISNEFSPILYIDKNTPPIISIHSVKDKIVDYNQSKRLHAKLDQLGIKNQLTSVPNGEHMAFGETELDNFYRDVFMFLNDIGIDEN